MSETQNYGSLSYQRLNRLWDIKGGRIFDPPALFDTEVLQRLHWRLRGGRQEGDIKPTTLERYLRCMSFIGRWQSTETVNKPGQLVRDVTIRGAAAREVPDWRGNLPVSNLSFKMLRAAPTDRLEGVRVQVTVPERARGDNLWFTREYTMMTLDADILAGAAEGVIVPFPAEARQSLGIAGEIAEAVGALIAPRSPNA